MKFIIKKAEDGQFFFVLKAKNGQVILTSETYRRKQNVVDVINSIQSSEKPFEVLDYSKETRLSRMEKLIKILQGK